MDSKFMSNIILATASNLISVDVRSNGQQIRELMVRAKDEGARVVHFPEGALSGYVKSEISAWEEVDWQCVRTEIGLICGLAKALGIFVVLGCNHRLNSPHLPHNSLYVISDSGEIVDRYDKRYCSHAEINNWYSPGLLPVIFTVDGYRFGLALCIELCFPELFMEYCNLGADCVLLSAYARDPMYQILAQARATDNNLWISVSTPAQCAAGLASAICGPDGSVTARASTDGAPSLIQTIIDKDDARYEIALNRARPWRALARTGDIYASRRVEDTRSLDKLSI